MNYFKKAKFKSPDHWLDLLLKLIWEGKTESILIGGTLGDLIEDFSVYLRFPRDRKLRNPDIFPQAVYTVFRCISARVRGGRSRFSQRYAF